MANDFTTIMPKILAAGLLALREQAVMPRLVNIDYGTDARQKGSTVDVPLPKAQTATSVTAAPTYSSAQANTPQVVQIPLDQWVHTDFYLTDKEMGEIDRNRHYVPMQMSEAIRALANDADTNVHAQYTGVYGYVGTAGVTPFSAVTTATDARKVLNQQLAPLGMRRAVLDPTAEAQALSLAAFSNFEQTGDMAVKIEGEIGRKFGFDWYMSQNVQTHTTGTASAAAATVGSTTAVGSSSLGLTAATSASIGTFVAGDVFTIAGDSQTYVVVSGTTLTSTGQAAISIDPPLKVIASSTSQITKKASHTVNLAFHPNAFAFVTRPLDAGVPTNPILAATDEMTGLTLRLELIRQFKQTAWDFDILHGAKLIRAELATRIAG